jgi:hypothetical protein
VTIGTESKITLALLGGIFIAAVGGTWQAARWGSAIENQIGQVDDRLRGIESQLATDGANDWTRNDMAIWTQRLREINEGAGVKVPVPLHSDGGG